MAAKQFVFSEPLSGWRSIRVLLIKLSRLVKCTILLSFFFLLMAFVCRYEGAASSVLTYAFLLALCGCALGRSLHANADRVSYECLDEGAKGFKCLTSQIEHVYLVSQLVNESLTRCFGIVCIGRSNSSEVHQVDIVLRQQDFIALIDQLRSSDIRVVHQDRDIKGSGEENLTGTDNETDGRENVDRSD